ncbi:MAG TPA: glycosyltransferase family 4 protein [Candidatus Nanoarchaeia archaeon]|nr:glycosyltransferase family 4 protein [Candidatus Nanoarchaeia archaeon]
MRSILYCVQRYRPDCEATSKEISLLAKYFPGHIHDLHLDGYFNFNFSSNITSYHGLYYPFFYLLFRIFSHGRIIHLYTSLCDRPYLPFLNKKKMIITSPNFFSKKRIQSKLKSLQKVRRIIVQSEVEKKELLAAGIKKEKISLIYPSVELEKFSYHEPKKNFTILNASCPGKVRDLHKRGVYLLFDIDPYLYDEQIIFLWRGGEFSLFMDQIKGRTFQHINIKNKIHIDMNEQYAKAHCTIIPYIQFDEYLKLIPTSVIESLAAGKPVLVSSQTGIADIIRANACGVVFNPTKEDLLLAIADMKQNYNKYQQNCRKTAEKYFSQEQFLRGYREIYDQMGEK